ncbi:hypothetical protein C2S51_007450 [Perilla frutescens var. frutescens]|nr:hypothetical protein C2S51_007450 [Perilla frutescens var. frutescens]
MDLTKKLSLLVFLVCVLISLKNQKAETDSRSVLGDPPARRNLGENESPSAAGDQEVLRYDYYSESCPSAEKIIRLTVRELYEKNISVAPALLRLVFHDCFVMGCDASVLLDSDGEIKTEKDTAPNLSLKGFEHIDVIKSKLEQACSGVVSCADTLVLAARESVVLVGGQFYPLLTGRKDSKNAFPQNALKDIPHPDFDVNNAIEAFALKGFDARETVALLGAHSTGRINCNFIRGRLFNFSGTNLPDPSINTEFVEVLRSHLSTSFENRAMRMDYEGPGKNFGTVYYNSLLQGKGLLTVDQQMTAGTETKPWVEEYASNNLRFRRDFGLAMMKLSNLQVLTAPEGEVRLNCRTVN